jgi:hypothetical protein
MLLVIILYRVSLKQRIGKNVFSKTTFYVNHDNKLSDATAACSSTAVEGKGGNLKIAGSIPAGFLHLLT